MIELQASKPSMRELVEQEFSENMRDHCCPTPGGCNTGKAECPDCCIDRVREFIEGRAKPSIHCDTCESACSGIMQSLKERGLL